MGCSAECTYHSSVLTPEFCIHFPMVYHYVGTSTPSTSSSGLDLIIQKLQCISHLVYKSSYGINYVINCSLILLSKNTKFETFNDQRSQSWRLHTFKQINLTSITLSSFLLHISTLAPVSSPRENMLTVLKFASFFLSEMLIFLLLA